MKNIAKNIKMLREEMGVTPTELSKKSGLSLAYISKLEKGEYKAPSLAACKSISEGLGITLQSFLERINFLNSKNNVRSDFQMINSTLRSNGLTPEQAEQITTYAKYLRKQNRRKK